MKKGGRPRGVDGQLATRIAVAEAISRENPDGKPPEKKGGKKEAPRGREAALGLNTSGGANISVTGVATRSSLERKCVKGSYAKSS